MKRELLKDIKKRQVKYCGHTKRYNALLKNILKGKVKGKSDTSDSKTSRYGQTVVLESIHPGQETEKGEDMLQPTLTMEMTPDYLAPFANLQVYCKLDSRAICL